MPKAVVKIDGAGVLARRLREMDDEVSGAHLATAVVDGSRILQQVAGELAPRRTGVLAGNIDGAAISIRPRKAVVHVGPTEDAFHGVFQELGTAYHSAQPFLRPAFDETKDTVVREIRDKLRRNILNAIRI